MSDTFCVHLPLEFPGGYRIEVTDPLAEAELLGHAAELGSEGGNYVLTVKGIESEEAARAILRKLHAGICWVALELKTGIRVSSKPQRVTYYDDPEQAGKNLMLQRPVDAVIDTALPAIVPEEARLARLSTGSVSVVKSTKPDRFFAVLNRGLEDVSAEAFGTASEAAQRIESAIELYVLAQFELNTVPRFLLQCTALEVLAPRGHREPGHVVEQVEAWVDKADARADEHSDDEVKQRDFTRLRESVSRLKSISHGERIRKFARQALERAGAEEAEDTVKRLTEAYAARGRFLHQGDSSKIGGAATDMNDILPVLLKAALKGGIGSAS